MSQYTFEVLNVQPANVTQMVGRLSQFATVTPRNPSMWRIEGAGIVADAVYDSDAQKVTVTIIDKPFYVSVGLIKQKVMEALA
jgi:hypothetical protein